jgi:hypothetical protein
MNENLSTREIDMLQEKREEIRRYIGQAFYYYKEKLEASTYEEKSFI